MRKKVVTLKHHSEAVTQRARVRDGFTLEKHLPRVDRFKAYEAPQKRGFSAAARPQNHRDFAFGKRKIDAV